MSFLVSVTVLSGIAATCIAAMRRQQSQKPARAVKRIPQDKNRKRRL